MKLGPTSRIGSTRSWRCENTHTYTHDEVTSLAAAFKTAIKVDAYPHLAEHGTQHFQPGPIHEVDPFELGLDLILDGLAKDLEALDPSPS
jgi:hypothetical protein